MPFPYFDRLSPRQQKIYLQSDRVTLVKLDAPALLLPLVEELRATLASEDRRALEAATQRLANGLTEMLKVKPVRIEMLAARPRSTWGELHGLYTIGEGGPPHIKLWMRTAAHRRVVAFKTFLRTFIHELGHHLDYAYLKLGDSLHTEGFFRRESSIVRQLLGGSASATPAADDTRP